MNIFWMEFSRNKKSFLIWSFIIVFFNVMTMMFYPTVAKQYDAYDKILKGFKSLYRALNMDKLVMSDLFGYFGIQSYLYITLFGSIFIMMMASGIISKEENEKTIEFLLSKPITRNTIVTAKLMCVLVYIFLFNGVFSVTNLIMFELVKREPYSHRVLLLLSIGPLLMHLTFAAIGAMLSVFIVKTKSVFPVSLGVVLGAFFMNILAALVKNFYALRFFSPFKYVDAADIIHDGAIALRFIIFMVAIVVVCIVSTYYFYNRKDIGV